MHITSLFYYPIKAIGIEAINHAEMDADGIQGDRRWAVTRAGAQPDEGWSHCGHFLRGATNPQLMAVTITRQDMSMVLHHPDLPDLVFDPENPVPLYDWLAQLCKFPVGTLYQPTRALTDNRSGMISILNDASLNILQTLNPAINRARFRGNIWFDGLSAWQETDLIGKHIGIGTCELKIIKPIERCKATCTNTSTGERDFDMIAALKELTGAPNFGLHATVTKAGVANLNDEMILL